MDGSRFDHLTRSLAAGTSRRTVLKALLGLGGAATMGGVVAEGPVEAARRPTPTPIPHKCPGVQTWNGTKCVCPPNLSQCVPSVGPACCNDQLVKPGAPDYSECCDNACCHGTCYGEELCCPTGNTVCNGRDCCDVGQACCSVDDCCSGACYAGNQFCCAAGTGEICGDDCCDTATERCCEREGGPVCIPIDGCCLDRDCPGDDAQCLAGFCNPQTNGCEQRSACTGDERCCPDQPGVGVCLGPDDCCAAFDCTDPPRDIACPVASCVENACHYEEMCSEGTFCCAGELCCPLPGGCCSFEDGTNKCVPECCDASNCKRPPDACSTPVCDADGYCHYEGSCTDGLTCCSTDGNVCAECCGDDTSTCDPQRYWPECVECIGGTCSAENTQFDPCNAFDGGWCDDGRCHACIDNDSNPCELDLQCCSGNCSVELGHCVSPA